MTHDIMVALRTIFESDDMRVNLLIDDAPLEFHAPDDAAIFCYSWQSVPWDVYDELERLEMIEVNGDILAVTRKGQYALDRWEAKQVKPGARKTPATRVGWKSARRG